ncbi:hypothetical protein M3M50_10900 [Pseudomonas bijieensis]|uniref:hypothetical protein n=1 Tax=Pseudomonas bijieensis TaxID=2681983 RepID=UPI00200FD5FA|nr:hypothetical protein [Pseudomonas bijieensis]UQI33106.1 hypothetical protein M3M50_10900 [Pseudomonas bijieensis]
MLFSDITIDAPNARSPFKIVNNGSTATDKELVMNDIRWRNAPSTRTTGGILSNTSGVQFYRAILDLKYRDAGAPAGLTIAADKISGLTESNSVTFTSIAASVQDVVVTFNNRFPKAPNFTCSGNLHTVGVVVAYIPNASSTSTGTIRMYSTGGAAMTAGISVTVNWTATLNE